MRHSRRSSVDDVTWLSTRLRGADQRELAAALSSPQEALTSGILDSLICMTICDDDGEPVAMYGVTRGVDPLIGHPWLLGSPKLLTIASTFLRESKTAVETLHEAGNFPLLLNYAASFNTVHLTWLKWCGFTLCKNMNVNGTPFVGFYRIQNV